MSLAPFSCQNCPVWHKSPLMCCQEAELHLIATGKTSQRYQRGQTIFQEGSRANGLYCVRQGKVKVVKTSGDGKEQIVRLAKEGNVLGYQALMAETPFSTSAVALDDCVVCLIPRSDVLSLVEQNGQFARGLMRLLSNSLGEAEQRLLHMTYKPVRERLAEALLVLYRTFHESASGPCSMVVPREDLASLMGTAKETASRLLADFKGEGILTTRGSSITILEPERLRVIATRYD